jgi:hypothetical protein
MSYNWGPNFIVPSKITEHYSGAVQLREDLDEDLLRKELAALGLPDVIVKITNPWYYRRKGTSTWIKIGESENKHDNFPVRWDTTQLKNGQYEVLGLMHVFVKQNNVQSAIARQSVVGVTVKN